MNVWARGPKGCGKVIRPRDDLAVVIYLRSKTSVGSTKPGQET